MKTIIPGTDVEYNPSIESTLLKVDEIKPERVDGIRRAAKYQVFLAARLTYPSARLILRDIFPTDFGLTSWEDTPSSTGWQNHTIAAKTIGDGRFVVVTGMRMILNHDLDTVPILGLRWTVGGAIVAIWDIHKAYNVSSDGTTIGNVVGIGPQAKGCITESPIIIGQNMVVTLDQYEEGAIKVMMPIEGYICEIEGKVLKA